MSLDIWLQLLAPIGVGIGVYAGVKGDLATLHERTRNHAEQLRDIWKELK